VELRERLEVRAELVRELRRRGLFFLTREGIHLDARNGTGSNASFQPVVISNLKSEMPGTENFIATF
jgi:hypothetical protein